MWQKLHSRKMQPTCDLLLLLIPIKPEQNNHFSHLLHSYMLHN
jgi:hypothetical protein